MRSAHCTLEDRCGPAMIVLHTSIVKKIVCLCEIKEAVMVDRQVQVSCLHLLLSQLVCLG